MGNGRIRCIVSIGGEGIRWVGILDREISLSKGLEVRICGVGVGISGRRGLFGI